MVHHHSVLIVGAGTVVSRCRTPPERPAGARDCDPRAIRASRSSTAPDARGRRCRHQGRHASTRGRRASPEGVTWIRRARGLVRARQERRAESGMRVTYDQLVVAAGIQLDWGKIKGLDGNLGKGGIVSNYSYDVVDKTWSRRFVSSRAATPCSQSRRRPSSAQVPPQKMSRQFADDHLGQRGSVTNPRSSTSRRRRPFFGVKKYATALDQVVKRKQIETHFRHDLVGGETGLEGGRFREPRRRLGAGPSGTSSSTSFRRRARPDSKRSPLANDAGWVSVHKHTLQHDRFPNESLGDCSSLPTSRTGPEASSRARREPARAEVGATPRRELRRLRLVPPRHRVRRLILAEFDYDGSGGELPVRPVEAA